MEETSSLSPSLQNEDEGNLLSPRSELIPFLRHVDDNVCEFTIEEYFLEVVQDYKADLGSENWIL